MAAGEVFTLHRGTQPLLVSVPHAGTVLPDDQRRRYVERAFAVEDTDWHLDTLFDFVRALGASFIVPRYSRYLIDLNRPKENAPMYPGVNNTELCPTRFFTGEPLYRNGFAPEASEIERRVATYWQPYHDALRGELERTAHRTRPRGAVRRPQHQVGTAVVVRGPTARPEPRHRRGGQLRTEPAHRPDACARCAAAVHARGRRPLQGWSHHAPLRQPRQGCARGAARDVLELLHGRATAPYEPDSAARARLYAGAAARCVHTMLHWTPHG